MSDWIKEWWGLRTEIGLTALLIAIITMAVLFWPILAIVVAGRFMGWW